MLVTLIKTLAAVGNSKEQVDQKKKKKRQQPYTNRDQLIVLLTSHLLCTKMSKGKAAKGKSKTPIKKCQAPDKPGLDHYAEERHPPNQPSEDAEAPHEGAVVKPSAQTPASKAVSPPTRRETTSKQKDAAVDKRRSADTAVQTIYWNHSS